MTAHVSPFEAKVGDTILATIDEVVVTVTAVTPTRDGATRITGHFRGALGKITRDFYFYPTKETR